MWALALRALAPMLERGAASAATRAGGGAMESKFASQAARGVSNHMLSKAQQSSSGSSGNQRAPQPSYTTSSTGPTSPQITSRMMGRGER